MHYLLGNGNFGNFIRKIIRIGVHVLWIFPVKKKRIFFDCYGGRGYSCNSKYVCEFFKENYADEYELVWSFRDPIKFRNISGIRAIKYPSLKWMYYFVTSKVLLTNSTFPVAMPKRKSQYFINLWHGNAYKRIGLTYDDSYLFIKEHMKASEDTDLFISISKTYIDTVIDDAFHYSGQILNCGYPRNDILIDKKRREEISQKVRDSLGISGYVVLFAPTFRHEGDGTSAKTMLCYESVVEAIKKKTGREVTLLVRSHYLDRGKEITGSNIIDVSNYSDMQELLCAADMLITDYSSCMWDYALTSRPCLLYMPDLKDYSENDRGFYYPVETMPGIISYNEEELLQSIADFDEKQCAEIAKEHLRKFGCWESGNASKRISELIVAVTNGKEPVGVEQHIYRHQSAE